MEEFEIGAKPIEGVGTSTLGLLGETERGPTKPKLITGWLNFQRVYGGHFEEADKSLYLPYSVEGFFANGGSRCYVARVVGAGATIANVALGESLTVTAVGEGSWGERVGIKVGVGTFSNPPDDTLFKLTVYYWRSGKTIDPDTPDDTADIIEDFDDLSVDSSSDNYYENKVNGISNLVVVTKEEGDSGTIPAEQAFTGLTGGADKMTEVDTTDYMQGTGSDEPGKRQGLLALNDIDEVAILYAPNATVDLAKKLIGACTTLKDRFAILDAPMGQSDTSTLKPRDDIEPSMFAAYYYPWIKAYNPLTKLYKTVPPGGHVAGIYARSDIERGVHKAPANEIVRGIKDLEFNIGKGEQDILNPRGVNCIRAFSGRGIRVWGGRTLSSNALWKYVNVRRLFIFIEESILKGTQWVVFEPNDQKLWARVKQTVTQFLTGVWKGGALMGNTPEEAFFVKCDSSTMTQDDIDNGRLIIIIGIAPVKPAEFVIFRIAQWQGGSAATE
jgi:phage tail sheath protein FI